MVEVTPQGASSSLLGGPAPTANTAALNMLLVSADVEEIDIPAVAKELSDAGFRSAKVLKHATVALLREFCPGILPGTALRIIAAAQETGKQVNAPPPPTNPTPVERHNEGKL